MIMKTALLFTGQGAQYTGMGKELYDNFKTARVIFNEAGVDIKNWCFEGSKEVQRQTSVTQPCVYTVTMAAYNVFMEELEKENTDIEVAAMAGFSLGEYSALTAAGVIDSFEKGLEIVKNRGIWMDEAGKGENGENIGGMSAAFGDRKLILECVEEARENGILEGVNFNSQQQTVVAGDLEALARFKEVVKEKRIKAIPLKVGGAFHSPMMEPARDKLYKILMMAGLKAPKITVYSNSTGEDLMQGISENNVSQELAHKMADQVKMPVYWQEIVEKLDDSGINAVVELGPGTTLIGLVQKIRPDLKTFHVENVETLNAAIKGLKMLRWEMD